MIATRARSSTGRRACRPMAASNETPRMMLMAVSVLMTMVLTEMLYVDGVESAVTGYRPSDGEQGEPMAAAPLDDGSRSRTSKATGAASRSNIRHRQPPHQARTAGGSLDADVQCNGLQSKRYISDGFCRTVRPISETLCTGYCVPPRALADYTEFVRAWSSTRRKQQAGSSSSPSSSSSSSSDWSQSEGGEPITLTGGSAGRTLGHRCVDGVVRSQRVRLVCDNGDTKVYRVRVVKSCVCSGGGSGGGGGVGGNGQDVGPGRRHSPLAGRPSLQQLNGAPDARQAKRSEQIAPHDDDDDDV